MQFSPCDWRWAASACPTPPRSARMNQEGGSEPLEFRGATGRFANQVTSYSKSPGFSRASRSVSPETSFTRKPRSSHATQPSSSSRRMSASRNSVPRLLPGRTTQWLNRRASGRAKNRRLASSAREISPFPAGASFVFRQRSREHLQAGIEQRGMHPGAIGISIGLGNRNRGGRKPHLSKRFAVSAPQLLNALETRAVFQAGISQGRVKLRGCFALRAPGANFVQAVLFLGATNKIRNLHAHVAGSVQGPRRIFVAAVQSLRWNCKSGKKRCRSMPGTRPVAKCARPWREESALPGTLRWIKPGSRLQKVPSKPRAPFPDTRKREKRRSPELCGRSNSAEYRFRSCSGTAPWAARSSHARQAKRALASPPSARRMHWADLPSIALARRDTLAEALSTAGRVHRMPSNRRWRRGRTTKPGW